MRSVTFFFIIYSILVLLGGIMSFWHGDRILSLYFEIMGSVFLFICLYFLQKRKKNVHIFIATISTILFVYYGYFFYIRLGFFEGIMAAISAFIIFANLNEYFKIS